MGCRRRALDEVEIDAMPRLKYVSGLARLELCGIPGAPAIPVLDLVVIKVATGTKAVRGQMFRKRLGLN